MNKALIKPLNLLEESMENISHRFEDNYDSEKFNQSRELIENYVGPSELEGICKSFNKMAENLEASEEKRKALEEGRQKMLADISHDLKTPITVISGYAKAIVDGVVKEEDYKKYLETIYNKSNHLSELINSFHEFSKLEHPDFKANKEKADICEFFRSYLAEKYEELTLQGFDIALDIPDDVIDMEFDGFLMKRVFENIINNTVKHNSSGTTIKAYLREYREFVEIIIGDDGVGIPSNMRKNIFEPFVVGDESRNTKQGSGLGMAIVKKIVEAHDGTIELLDEKSVDMITAYSIKLPK